MEYNLPKTGFIRGIAGIFALFVALSLAACGGSGSSEPAPSSPDSGPGPGVGTSESIYPGENNQALITDENIGEIFQALFELTGTVEEISEDITGVFELENGQHDGVYIEVTESGDEAEAYALFDNFAPEAGVLISSGEISADAGGIDYFGDESPTWTALTYSDLDIQLGSDAPLLINGEVYTARSAESSGTITINADVTTGGKTYRLDGAQNQIVGYSDRDEITFSGRFYHHDHGYVDVTTPHTLVEYSTECTMTEGTIRLTGSNGYVDFEVMSTGFNVKPSDGTGMDAFTIEPADWGCAT